MAATNLAKEGSGLASRFSGSLVGAVVGDCLGAHWEGMLSVKPPEVVRFFSNLKERIGEKQKMALHPFTDDTAMARSVANSLIDKQSMDAKDMARKFVREFFQEPDRGYGSNVGQVFKQLREMQCLKPHFPASTQFNGQGSYGNGGAMRIAPAALFGYNYTPQALMDVCDESTKITHSHADAINGARLQALAVHTALHMPPGGLETDKFLKTLKDYMSSIEVDQEGEEDGPPKPKRRAKRKSEEQPHPYCFKIDKIQEFLKEEETSRKDIEETLGTDISALGSVPAAIYSFLRSTKPISDIPSDNPLERTIIYAVSLGGDTDTIATMAGAIAGAYYGIDEVPKLWMKICEGVTDALVQAEKLHYLCNKNEKDENKE